MISEFLLGCIFPAIYVYQSPKISNLVNTCVSTTVDIKNKYFNFYNKYASSKDLSIKILSPVIAVSDTLIYYGVTLYSNYI